MNELDALSLRDTDNARIGTTELGCFQLKRIIGRGSFGTSYLADQVGFDREAVVKIAHAALFDSQNAELVRRRFAEELRAATRVEHPNLVTLYTAGETSDALPVIAMEFVPGRPFADLLAASRNGLPTELLQPAFAQLGSAVAALHDAGVVHRDLSPNNVMLDTGPPIKTKVLDFGVAKLRGRPRMTYGAVGTPRYMAPEQVIGRAVPASDIFAMGAILWWALTGQEYRNDALTLEDLHHVALAGAPRPDPREISPDIPVGVAALVGQMVAHIESERPTALEFCARWRSLAPDLHDRPQATRSPIPPPPPIPGGSNSGSTVVPEHSRSSARPTTGHGSGPRVLLVDGNSITQHLMAGCLRRAGCRVRSAADPRDATRSESPAFDMVVLSSELADADPLDVAAYLHECHPNVWIVLAGPAPDPARADAVGLRASIGVPHGFERLTTLVDELATELALRNSAKGRDGAIDRTALEHLHRDDPHVVCEAIELFLGQAPESLAHIEDAQQHHDVATIRQQCRSLSTGARALGANHLARLAHALGELVQDGDLESVSGFVSEMEREYGLVFRALMEVHSSATTTTDRSAR